MGITAAFLAVVAAIVVWWLSHQRLAAKPWLEEGVIGEAPVGHAPGIPTAKIGLGVFLAVAGSLFALFSSAYLMRMHMGADWRPMPVPPLLWLNTGALAASSVALHWAQVNARRGRMDGVRNGLQAGAVLALGFLVGQLLAWHQLDAAGYYLASNPANSFFYLLTAVHGVHVLGGMVALARPIARIWRGLDVDRVRLSVELCAIYWHFLLLVWLILFALLLHH